MRLGVVDRVHLPLVERTAVVRVEKHEDLRHLPVPIEHELRGIARNLDQPVQPLQQHIGNVHIHSSVLGQQRQSNQVRVGLLESSAAVVEEKRLVDPLEVVLADVLLQVGLVDLDDLEAGDRGEELDVALGQLVSRVAFGNSVVPEKPDQLWQGRPFWRVGNLGRFFGIGDDKRLLRVGEEAELKERSIDYVILVIAFFGLPEFSFKPIFGYQDGNISHRPNLCLQFTKREPCQLGVSLLILILGEYSFQLACEVILVDSLQPIIINGKLSLLEQQLLLYQYLLS